MSDHRPQVVFSKGCMKVAQSLPQTSLVNDSKSVAISLVPSSGDGIVPATRGSFHGLTICVTGLSKDARKQVHEATERMGGHYSPDLHPECTHLVVQCFGGRKFEHALKHGLRRGLFVVTLSWFVNCVKQNERLDESLYSVKNLVSSGVPLEEFSHLVTLTNSKHSCLPVVTQEEGKSLSLAVQPVPQLSSKDLVKQGVAVFSGMCFYVDPDLTSELRAKVVEAAAKEGATFIDHWFIGCGATHVVCEGNLMLKYLGFNTDLVTPLWVLKTSRERHLQRLVQLSADLARQISMLFYATQNGHTLEETSKVNGRKNLAICGPDDDKFLQDRIQEREEKINAAKAGVRRRRGPLMQVSKSCRTIPRPITPSVLLESLCWSITEQPSAACFCTDSFGSTVFEHGPEADLLERASILFDVRENERVQQGLSGIPENEIYTRLMNESEKKEVVFKGTFLTILFPIDRFAEMGPSARTFFSEKGFSRYQILDHIYSFYQEYMSAAEVDVAIHSDSKHADRLRSLFADKDAFELGYISIKRCEFVGSRKSFECLKRIGRENTGHVYELWLGA